MADDDKETLELTETVAKPEEQEPQTAEKPAPDEDGDETIVRFEDEDEDQEGDSPVIRRLRERNRELNRRLGDARRSIPPEQPIELGEEPTWESCDYDEERWKNEHKAWEAKKTVYERKRAAEAEEARRTEEGWRRDMDAYNRRKKELAIPDYEDIESSVTQVLSPMQQAVIVKAAADPAVFVAAIGRSEDKLEALAKIDDPIKLAVAVTNMEGSIRMVVRRKGANVDEPVYGSAPIPRGVDSRLAYLEKQAQQSGDYTKLFDYKRKLKGAK